MLLTGAGKKPNAQIIFTEKEKTGMFLPETVS
jgi:hypothetical protein